MRQAVDTFQASIANLKHLLDLQGLPGGACRMAIDAPDAERQAALAQLVSG